MSQLCKDDARILCCKIQVRGSSGFQLSCLWSTIFMLSFLALLAFLALEVCPVLPLSGLECGSPGFDEIICMQTSSSIFFRVSDLKMHTLCTPKLAQYKSKIFPSLL